MKGNKGEVMVGTFVVLSVIYMAKSIVGIDLVANCHADRVLLGLCSSQPVASEPILPPDNYTFF